MNKNINQKSLNPIRLSKQLHSLPTYESSADNLCKQFGPRSGLTFGQS